MGTWVAAGLIFLGFGALHFFFPKRFLWREELSRLSLLNRQIFWVHCGFIVLTLLCVMRLFAAVGLWIQVRWGALLLLASLVIELVLHLTGSGWVTLTLLGFIFKLATMLATIALVALAQLVVQRHIVD